MKFTTNLLQITQLIIILPILTSFFQTILYFMGIQCESVNRPLNTITENEKKHLSKKWYQSLTGTHYFHKLKIFFLLFKGRFLAIWHIKIT